MAPVYLLAKSWSWPSAFLLLRLATWTLAFAGFVIGCRATQQALMTLKVSPRLCLLAALWPFLFASSFPRWHGSQ